VVFFDVGQGDAILITTPHGHQILVDGGPSPSMVLDQLGRAMPFWDRSLDLVVLTHPDEDHLAGLISVLERYQVGHAIEPALPHDTPLAKEWERLLHRRGVTQLMGQRGMRIALEDGLLLEVLHPGPVLLQGTDADDNNNSLVIRAMYGEARVLLTGDLGHEGERALLRTAQPMRSQVLKVAHHGAGGGTGESFLAAVDPQLAIISVGEDNHFGHPAAELLERLDQRAITTLRTDQRGQIELVTDGERIWVRTDR
jgi:competence protein ComEC